MISQHGFGAVISLVMEWPRWPASSRRPIRVLSTFVLDTDGMGRFREERLVVGPEDMSLRPVYCLHMGVSSSIFVFGPVWVPTFRALRVSLDRIRAS